MGAGKGGKYQITRIRSSLMYLHACENLICLSYFGYAAEIKSRFHTMTEHIHCNCDQIHITGSLSVSKERALHPVGSGQHAHLGITDSASSVIVGMNADKHAVPVFQVLVNVLNLSGEYMRHCNLDRGRYVDNHLSVR